MSVFRPMVPILALSGILLLPPAACAQTQRRTALIPAGGNFPDQQQRLVNALTTRIIENGGIELIDRQKTDAVMREQNLQVTPNRFSAASIAQLGRLLGIPSIVFVRVDNYSATNHNPSGSHTIVYTQNVLLKATAEIVSVETGAIVATPHAQFDQTSQVVVHRGNDRIYFPGGISIPKKESPSTVDPDVSFKQLQDVAIDSISAQLAPQVAQNLGAVPSPAEQLSKIPKVAGVQGRMTFLNVGSLKLGDQFEIIRMADSGMTNPDNNQPIM